MTKEDIVVKLRELADELSEMEEPALLNEARLNDINEYLNDADTEADSVEAKVSNIYSEIEEAESSISRAKKEMDKLDTSDLTNALSYLKDAIKDAT